MKLKEAQEAVKQFMVKAGQDTPDKPCLVSITTAELRHSLHKEEACDEYADAVAAKSVTLVADSLADSLVVILGTAVAHGIDIEPVFEEVMRSNMSKFIDGHRRDDGKWIKGPSYSPANIAPIIEAQSQPVNQMNLGL